MLPGVHCASSAQPMLAPLLIKTKVPVIYFMLISSFEQTPKQGKYQLCQTLTPSAIRRQQPEKEHQKSRPEANLPSPSFRENSVQRKAKPRPLLPARVLSLSPSRQCTSSSRHPRQKQGDSCLVFFSSLQALSFFATFCPSNKPSSKL